MSPQPQSPSTPERTPPEANAAGSYRLAWACLPLMLVLSLVVLFLFGVSWWTALVVALLLACPAVIAVVIYLGYRPFPNGSQRDRHAPS